MNRTRLFDRTLARTIFKAMKTLKHATHLLKLQNELKEDVATVNIISATEENMVVKGSVNNYAWHKLLTF